MAELKYWRTAGTLTPDEFYKCIGEIILNFQAIEHDLKLIYSYMHKGNIDENYDKVENLPLGAIIQTVKELDNSDGNPHISKSDYNFLKQMKDKRNYWCHQAFVDFIYDENCWYSTDYEHVSSKLKTDLEKITIVSNNLEKVRIHICKQYDY